MKLTRQEIARYGPRALLIALVGAAIVGFGFNYTRAWRASRRAIPSGPQRVLAGVWFQPLEGSRLLASHECTMNGRRTVFAQYRSRHPSRKVIEQFEQRFGGFAPEGDPTKGPMVRVVSRGYSAATAVDSDGRLVGIVAFDEPKAGGSTYFVGRSRGGARAWRAGDCPGEEVPGIPRPLRSRRVFCIDGIGGIPSRLLVYEGSGAISDTVDLFASEMPKAGWQRNTDVERVVQRHLGGRFLSFLKGTERAMIYIEREPATGKVRTAVAYSDKRWLPPGRGL